MAAYFQAWSRRQPPANLTFERWSGDTAVRSNLQALRPKQSCQIRASRPATRDNFRGGCPALCRAVVFESDSNSDSESNSHSHLLIPQAAFAAFSVTVKDSSFEP